MCHVAILDDSPFVHGPLAELLRIEGYVVGVGETLARGAELIELRPKLVFCDLSFDEAALPGLVARARWLGIAVVTMSGSRHALERTRAWGVAAALLKPFEGETVRVLARRYVVRTSDKGEAWKDGDHR